MDAQNSESNFAPNLNEFLQRIIREMPDSLQPLSPIGRAVRSRMRSDNEANHPTMMSDAPDAPVQWVPQSGPPSPGASDDLHLLGAAAPATPPRVARQPTPEEAARYAEVARQLNEVARQIESDYSNELDQLVDTLNVVSGFAYDAFAGKFHWILNIHPTLVITGFFSRD